MHRGITTVLLCLSASLLCAGCDRSAAITTSRTNTISPASAEIIATSAQTEVVKRPATTKEIEDKSFDDLKFEMEENEIFQPSMLTAKVEELFGRRIRIRGYIYPTLKKRGLKKFVLVRDNLECCFGPGAALYDCILVHMNEGETAEFSIRPVAVEGTLLFEKFHDFDGTVRAIYRLNGESVE